MPIADYEVVIGLEIHAQIATKTKLFCPCSNDSFGKDANSNVCPICMGFPGMLPVINEDAVRRGIRAALAIGCEIPEFSKFDRKNYFYPDLPNGYQISQFDKPVSQNGSVDIEVNGTTRSIGITRLHLENDAGKLTHVSEGTLCDYNRSGCPLMEIVSEPDMRSREEASAYAHEIRRIMRYVGSSECDMEKGMMRFDINVSLRLRGEKKLGTKVEVKNVNSFRALERAIDFEVARQAGMLDRGEKIAQETRGWDDPSGETQSQRSKEEAHDYRYFPEPDLPPLSITADEVAQLKKEVPELPFVRRRRFVESYGLTEADAYFLAEEPAMGEYFEEVVKISADAKKAAAFVTTIVVKSLKRDGLDIRECPVSSKNLGALLKLVAAGTITNNQAKGEVFDEMYTTGKEAEVIVKEKGLAVVSDSGAIEKLCDGVIGANPQAIADFKAGKQNAVGFLVGQIMKESKGKANPALVQEILRKKLTV